MGAAAQDLKPSLRLQLVVLLFEQKGCVFFVN